jgi:hypothetical protein
VVNVQALGTKDYYMRDNTVARRTHLGETLDFSCIRDERSTFFGGGSGIREGQGSTGRPISASVIISVA